MGGAVVLRAMVKSEYPMRQSCSQPSIFSVFLFDIHTNWTQTITKKQAHFKRNIPSFKKRGLSNRGEMTVKPSFEPSPKSLPIG